MKCYDEWVDVLPTRHKRKYFLSSKELHQYVRACIFLIRYKTFVVRNILLKTKQNKNLILRCSFTTNIVGNQTVSRLCFLDIFYSALSHFCSTFLTYDAV